MRSQITLCALLVACGCVVPHDPGDVSGHIDVLQLRWRYGPEAGGPGEFASSRVVAAFHAGGEPAWHREALRDDTCRLLVYDPGYCTACDGICVAPAECRPWPTLVSVGRVTLTGLVETVSLSPDTLGRYSHDSAMRPPPLFAAGATITASSSNGPLGPFEVQATGVPPLEVTLPDHHYITLEPGQDHRIAWTPADAEARVRVTLNANNRGHGQPYLAIIECDVPDAAGEVIIPRTMIDLFPETSAWFVCAGTDCPPSQLLRYRAGVIDTPGDITLRVGDAVLFGVEHHP